ncbi:WxL domain-containing protein [Streptomyces xanthophaeus]|uniref:beta-xylosidase n=1 Tax=Streptomyces xanthophaeus TaxID=67385 RepID=UPI003661D428
MGKGARSRRWSAAVGTAVLAAATGGVLSPPAAAEGEPPPVPVPGQVTFPTQCLPPQEAGLPPAEGPTTARVTVSDPTPRVGDTVTVTYRLTGGPAVNPVAGELPADVLTPTGRIVLGGAQSGEVTVVGARRNDPVREGGTLPAVTMTGTFTVTAPGEITLAPGGYTLHTSHLLDLDTVCTATPAATAAPEAPATPAVPEAPAAPATSEAPGTPAPPAESEAPAAPAAPAALEAPGALAALGAPAAPAAPPVPGAPAAPGASAAAAGLPAAVPPAAPGPAPGPAPAPVPAAASGPVAVRITVSPLPTANLRSVSLAAAHGAPGAKVAVTGAGFLPGAAVTVAGRAGAAETADRVAATADELGVVRAELPVTDRTTTAVVAYEGRAWSAEQGSGPAAYAVLDAAPPQPVTQKVTATVEPGALAMTQTGQDIALGAVPYGEGGAAPGRIATVTVQDARGGPAGWSLTGKVSDFTGPGGVRIPGAALSWTPSCTAAAGSPSTCAAGSAGPVGPDGAALASTPDAPLAGGTFTVDATVALQVPPYTPPGAYAAVLTLTLS